jgi:tRNA-specific 2-thiouridylase
MKVMIGLSGGVDSAVAAYLLKEQGHEVVGGFMRNWDAFANNDVLGNPTLNQDICPQEQDYNDAKAIAQSLGIPLLRVDFVKEYWQDVFTYFLKEYELGRTPNPDIFCNKYIKFSAFKRFAEHQGCQAIAMGHYAKRRDQDGKSYLVESADSNKDQTYFLSQISQAQLAFTLFPLGDIEKADVRAIAFKLGLAVAAKKDSTGVCFIGERHFKLFLKNYIPAQPGPIVDVVTRDELGRHEGVFYYTIGQRRGLGIGGLADKPSGSWYVVSKNVKKNILYVTSESEQDYLYGDEVVIDTLNFITDIPTLGGGYRAKFRYRQAKQAVRIKSMNAETMVLTLEEPVKALTPGQGAVLYLNDVCLGGGLIKEVYYKGRLINK